MPIQLECDSCGRRVKVKEEYAGRKIRCPACEEPIMVPKGGDEFDVDFEEEFDERPSAKSRGRSTVPGKKRASQKSTTEKGWFRRHWHWVAALVMMLFALWPKVGLVIAGLFAFVGVAMALIGGIYPFFRVLFGAPGTVLSMILSTRARFDMMRQPDNHPYKVLVRTAFDPTRGLFWKGVLLIVMFIPAAIVNSNIGEVFKSRGPDAAPNPNLVGPGHRPVGVPPQGQPNQNPNFAGGQNPGQPGFNPQGIPNQNPATGNNGQPGFPPQGNPAPNQGGSGQVFAYTLKYQLFTGEGSVKDAALAALKIHPDFPEDTLQVDEEAKTIQFQYKVRIAPAALAKLFASRGFRSLNVQMSSQ